ncbi:hypothetical protein PV326_014209 [Microctonus aethiopoides]|nr:hypothetical protein PV326_014209 [Microctonus aethiopoides]
MPFIRPKYHPQTFGKIIRFVFWLMKELFPIFSMAFCATKTVIEMNKTSGIIYKILSRCKMSLEINTELKHFLLELPHNEVELSAYNIVTVDNKILLTIFSSVVSNLIILIQFQLDGLKRAQEDNNN